MSYRQPGNWDPNGDEYRCCCNKCHVKKGVWILGILESICVALNLLGYIITITVQGSDYIGSWITGILSELTCVVVLVLLFMGLIKENAILLIPHLVVQVIALIFLWATIVIAIIMILTRSKWAADTLGVSDDTDRVKYGYSVLVVTLVMSLFEVWFFVVVRRCYQFYRDQARFVVKPIGMHPMPI